MKILTQPCYFTFYKKITLTEVVPFSQDLLPYIISASYISLLLLPPHKFACPLC